MTGRPERGLAACAAAIALAACSGQGSSVLPTEPLQVVGGQFIAGALPGTPPGTAGASADGGLSVTQINVPIRPIGAGWANQAISGLATTDSVAVGMRMPEGGTGYWVVPIGAPDTNNPGQSSFGFTTSFNAGDAPGATTLLFVAIGPGGVAGEQNTASVCLESAVPDNGHACNPTNPKNYPPAAVISLSWDTNFDLDLHVTLPSGQDIGPQTATAALFDAGAPPMFDRDSLASCVPDGVRQEDLVFQETPAHGAYLLRVDPFAPCGQQVAHFTVTVYVRAGACPNCGLTPVFQQSGELLATQVTGGATPGLYVGQWTL